MPRPARTAKTRTLQRLARKAASAGPPGWGGGGWSGGPLFVDAFRSRRAPSPPELVEACKGVVHACTMLNQGGVARTRLGLYVTTGEGQSRPKCAVHPKLRRQTKAMMAASGQVSRTCLYHQKMAAAAEVEEVAEHPLLAMIQHPNDDWDYDSWVRYAVLCLDVLGWFFSWPESTSSLRGKPVDLLLWPLLAQYVLPVRYPDGSLTAKYTYFGAEYEPSDLVRGRFVSARDPYGLGYGPTQAAFAYVGLSDQYASVQENLLTQGGKISGYFTEADPAVPIGAPDAQKYERELNATTTRANAGRLVYVPGNVKLVPTQWPPADLAALEVDDRAMKRIANCMGVPLSLIKQEDMSLASAEAGHRQHAELAVDPRCVLIANALTRWAHAFGRNHGLEGWDRLYFAFDNPVPEDEERKAKIVDMNLKNGRLTINEANEPDGIPHKEWGDEPWLPSTWVQPSTAAEMRERAATLAERQADQPSQEGEEEDGGDTENDGPPEKPPAKSYRRPHIKAKPKGDVPRAAAILGAALDRLGLASAYVSGAITPAQRYRVLHEVRLDARAWMRSEAERLYAEVGPAEAKSLFGDAAAKAGAFFAKARRYLREAFTAAALTVLGPDPLNAAELHALDQQFKQQAAYLDRFEDATLNGAEVDGTLVSRAEQYGSSVWGVGVNVVRSSAVGSGVFDQERRIHVGADEPCDVCSEQQGRSWVPVGTLKAIGDSECRSSCHCHFEFRLGDEGEVYTAGRGPMHDNERGAA